MRNEQRSSNPHDYRDPWDRGTYQTGSTEPPKNHNGLITLLLVMVIFLAGIVSIMGFLNIRLFAALNEQKQSSVSVSVQNSTNPTGCDPTENVICTDGKPHIAIEGEALDAFYRRYYRLPEGMFITQVEPDSGAAADGLKEGDILMRLDGTPITDEESLEVFLSNCRVGDRVEATIYRSRQQLTLEITLENAEEE